ncbi:MAG: hypothetical protein GXP62_18750, partial [Oligoflexia bacterium]|nr:hypothetical protein [Oligoflexia bacterium]
GRWLSELRRLSDLSPEDGWLQRLTVIIALDCATNPPSELLVQLISRAAQAQPDSADLPWLRARVYLATGDQDAALQSLNQADPTDPRAARLAVALLEKRAEPAAILDRLEPLHGEPDRAMPADLRCVEAKAALELGQGARAAREAIRGMLQGQEACREVAASLAAQGALSAEQQRWFDGL